MKKLLILILTIGFANQIQAQNAVDDTFVFRNDTFLDYNLFVKNNDITTNNAKAKISKMYKIGANAANFTIGFSLDSNYININDALKTNYIGEFVYFIRDSSGNTDSAIVNFSRSTIPQTMYPGDANNDNLVNHLDLLSIGVFYNKYGEPRHNIDTNSVFTPKRVNNWFFQAGGINGKFADIDGNSIVNIKDVDLYKQNLGQSKGVYNPLLSDTNSTNRIFVNISSDTILFDKDTNIFRIPIKINSSTPNYGFGYSMNVMNLNKSTQLDTFYNKYSIQDQTISPVWQDQSAKLSLSINEKISKVNHTNLSYVKTNGKSEVPIGEAGVVEVVVEDILIGIAKADDVARIRVNISEAVMIDHNYNRIPVKPISKYIYLKKRYASIQSGQESKISAYPTQIGSALMIEKSSIKPQTYFIYNSLGQIMDYGVLKSEKTRLENISWTPGIYYLKVENSTEVIRLQKQ